MYSIEIAPAAERALKKLPKDVRRRVFKTLQSLQENARPSGVKKLSGPDDIYRMRTGDFRILYQIQDSILVVLVLKIGHRREVYR